MNVFFSGMVAHVSLVKDPMMYPQPSVEVDAGDLMIVLQFGLWHAESAHESATGLYGKLTPAEGRQGKAPIH